LRAATPPPVNEKVGVHRFYAAHPNLVRRGQTAAIDRIWVGDITYLKVGTTWRSLAEALRTFLAASGVRPSACTSGPGDNAHMESFFHSMNA
jgi:transposase InsO family protein